MFCEAKISLSITDKTSMFQLYEQITNYTSNRGKNLISSAWTKTLKV